MGKRARSRSRAPEPTGEIRAARARSHVAPPPSGPPPPRPSPSASRRLMMTSFGFNDAGGGTAVPRLAAKELARRGWEVTVFHAATRPSASGEPYEVLEWMEDGVRLLG